MESGARSGDHGHGDVTQVNATYSAAAYNTAGTITGSPGIVFLSGYVAASNQTKGALSKAVSNRYPVTLDQAGAVRALGTVSILATGIGGTSAMRVALNWREIR